MHLFILNLPNYLYGPTTPLDLRRFFSFLILYIAGKTQPVARPLPTHRTTQTREKCKQDIYASSGIRTHDPIV
jgi:hypothetical protein